MFIEFLCRNFYNFLDDFFIIKLVIEVLLLYYYFNYKFGFLYIVFVVKNF